MDSTIPFSHGTGIPEGHLNVIIVILSFIGTRMFRRLMFTRNGHRAHLFGAKVGSQGNGAKEKPISGKATRQSQHLLSRIIAVSFTCFLCIALNLELVTCQSYLDGVSHAMEDNHYLVFNEIGRMASAATYIHVLVPINFTSIVQQGAEFQRFLNDFEDSMTSRKWPLGVTRESLMEVHTVMQHRLNVNQQKLTQLHSLLPNNVEITDASELNRYTVMSDLHHNQDEFVPPHNLTRSQRAIILPILAGIAGIVGTFMGLYSTVEVTRISSELTDLKQSHNTLIHLSNEHSKLIQELASDLKEMHNQFKSFVYANPAMIYARYNEHMREYDARVRTFLDVIQHLQKRRLAVGALTNQQLSDLHDTVSNIANAKQLNLLTLQKSDFHQVEVSYIRKGLDIYAILHIPCMEEGEMMTIYRYIAFPIPLPETEESHSPLSIKNALTGSEPNVAPDLVQDDTTAAKKVNAQALYVVADSDLIAVDSQNRYRLLTNVDLAECIQRHHVYLCEKQYGMRIKMSESCLGSLYLRHAPGVREYCHFDKRPLHEEIFPLGGNKFLVFSPIDFTAVMKCKTGYFSHVRFGKSTHLTLPEGCEITLNSNVLRVQQEHRIRGFSHVASWKWDPLSLPADLIDSSIHLDMSMKSLADNLTDLERRTTKLDEIPQLVDGHFFSSFSASTVLFWLVVTVVVAGLAILGMYCCKRNATALAPPLMTVAFGSGPRTEYSYSAAPSAPPLGPTPPKNPYV